MRALVDVATRFGAPMDAEALARFLRYRELLLDANTRFNLTSITDPDLVETRLFAESLELMPLLPSGELSLLDVGSGGGIPGLPIAIARPELRVFLIDATQKKVRFLSETSEVLGLDRVTAVAGRAEELGRDPAHRERYDVVTARAVARLATLVEYVLPFLAVGGIAILPKGPGVAEELEEAQFAIAALGGAARPLYRDTTVVLDKIRATPLVYPRRTGVAAKKPLLASTR